MARKLLIAILFAVLPLSLSAQRAALSTDPLKWATLSPNVGFDIALSERVTFDIELSFNPFNRLSDNIGIKHIAFSPEFRFWLNRPFYGSYFGANMTAFVCDAYFEDRSFKGQMVNAGVSYGYSFVLADRWSLTPSFGVGVGVAAYYGENYNRYDRDYNFKILPFPVRFGLALNYLID